MKPLDEVHVFDYRPRFNESDHQLIQALARHLDLPPAVLIRHLVRQQLAELKPGPHYRRSTDRAPDRGRL